MILINSAAYVNDEFRNEFGAIPPCFLPIGNRKLLVYQVESLQATFSNEKIVLSLPQKYTLSIDEQNLITSLNLTPVFVPENISLGMAVLYVLNTVEFEGEVLRLLHGDTLLKDFPQDKDCIAVVRTQDDYAWEFEEKSTNPLVWCGFFAFSSYHRFIRALATTQGNFIQSVYDYTGKSSNSFQKEVYQWFDLGHINTYFRSRSAITTQRAFNSLKIKNGIVWKSGSPARKIEAEANWFLNLPPSLKRFTPQLIQSGVTEDGRAFYETEYLPLLPLNEIFVHGKNPVGFWEKILGLVSLFMNEARNSFPTEDQSLYKKVVQDSIALYADKTYERLESYANQQGIDLDKPVRYDGVELPSLRDIAQECIARTLELPVIPTVSHGDLCFSNIMYDSRSNNIKVIDPRGLNINQELTIYGNQTYDLAKLCHSFVGLYDFIIADSFVLERSEEIGVKLIFNIDSRLEEIQKVFLDRQLLSNIHNKDIIVPTILLFLSMIPLHFDKPHRQEAMLANALRLYVMRRSII